MARKRGRGGNRRRKPAGRGKWLLALLVVAAAVAGSFLFLQSPRKPLRSPKSATKPPAMVRMPLPPRAVQQKVSSVSAAAKVEVATVPREKGRGRLAIIIDDMGTNMQELQSLLAIREPLTFSVIPSLAHAKAVAEAAHAAGEQVMVHMPMEPEGYPKQPMEKIGLLVSMEKPEIVRRVNGFFQTVPHAVGANNHMGSRFTQDGGRMEVVLKVLKEKGVFFVDSKTSPSSVGYRTARSIGLKCAERQVFLDNVQEDGAIRKQLEQAAAIARKKGAAIAICHPHPATIRTLRAAIPELVRSGITLEFVSKQVH